jgi:hypothetical protein
MKIEWKSVVGINPSMFGSRWPATAMTVRSSTSFLPRCRLRTVLVSIVVIPDELKEPGVNEFLVVRAGTRVSREIVYAGVKEQGGRVVSKFADMAGED